MRPLILIAFGTALALLPLGEIEAQRRCTKGIPCGKTCIAANRTCRTGSPPSRPAPSPLPRAAATAPPRSASPETSASKVDSARAPIDNANGNGLTVPGIPGYFALDSTELIEVQAARLRALERARRNELATTLPLPFRAPTSAERTADTSVGPGTSSTSGPWVASTRGTVYYKTGCRGANTLVVRNRIYFQSEQEAQVAGYRRSKASGC